MNLLTGASLLALAKSIYYMARGGGGVELISIVMVFQKTRQGSKRQIGY